MLKLILALFGAMIITSCGGQPGNPEYSETSPSLYGSQIQFEALSGSLGVSGSTVEPRAMNETSIALLMHFEGWSSQPYDDPADYCTIGFGHLIALTTCDAIELGDFAGGISKSRGRDILIADARLARSSVEDLISARMTDNEFSAVSSFVFNVGRRNFANSTMRRLINNGRSDLAANEFRRWVKAGGQTLPGLVVRRNCEKELFLGNIVLEPGQEFDRSRCDSLGVGDDVADAVDIIDGE